MDSCNFINISLNSSVCNACVTQTGILFSYSEGEIIIENCTFSNIVFASEGKGVEGGILVMRGAGLCTHVVNTTFQNIIVTAYSSIVLAGSLIFSTNQAVIIQNCRFTSCYSASSLAWQNGLIFTQYAKLSIVESIFYNCYWDGAGLYSGQLFVVQNNSIIFERSSIIQTISAPGPAFSSCATDLPPTIPCYPSDAAGQYLNISSSYFRMQDMSVAFVGEYWTVNVVNSTFDRCNLTNPITSLALFDTETEPGGSLNINNCTFENNRATSNRTIIWMTKGSLLNSIVSNNAVESGSIIVASNVPLIQISGSLISYNQANSWGGILFINRNAGANVISVENCLFVGNSAYGTPGIGIESGEAIVSNCIFENNVAQNYSSYQGAIAVGLGSWSQNCYESYINGSLNATVTVGDIDSGTYCNITSSLFEGNLPLVSSGLVKCPSNWSIPVNSSLCILISQTIDPLIVPVYTTGYCGQDLTIGGSGPWFSGVAYDPFNSSVVVPGNVWDANNGTYLITYNMSVASNYSCMITYGDVTSTVIPSVFGPVAILPGPVYPNSTLVWGSGVEGGYINSPETTFEVYLQACDQYGNPLNYGGDPFSVQLADKQTGTVIQTNITDYGNGTYCARYTLFPDEGGEYKLEIMFSNQICNTLNVIYAGTGVGILIVSPNGSDDTNCTDSLPCSLQHAFGLVTYFVSNYSVGTLEIALLDGNYSITNLTALVSTRSFTVAIYSISDVPVIIRCDYGYIGSSFEIEENITLLMYNIIFEHCGGPIISSDVGSKVIISDVTFQFLGGNNSLAACPAVSSKGYLSIFNSAFMDSMVTNGFSIVCVDGIGDVKISNSTFIRNIYFGNESPAHGVCLFIQTVGDILIKNSYFVGNILSVSNNLVGSSGGGAAWIIVEENHMLQIINSTLESNAVISNGCYSISGGGIVINLNEGSHLIINLVQFTNNSCSMHTTRDCKSQPSVLGGGLVVTIAISADIQLYNNSFAHNFVHGSGDSLLGFALFGGAAYIGGDGSSANVSVTSSKFHFNSIRSYNSTSASVISQGGAVAYYSNTSSDTSAYVQFLECDFIQNEVHGSTSSVNTQSMDGVNGGNAYGGAIYFSNAQVLRLISCQFFQNVVFGGNGIYSSILMPQHSTWDMPNIAVGGNAFGGAVYIPTASASIFLESCLFTNNGVVPGKPFELPDQTTRTCGDDLSFGLGGGIYTAGHLISNNTRFDSNYCIYQPNLNSTISFSSMAGGAVYVSHNATICNGTFNSNHVNGYLGSGGAMAVALPDHSTVIILKSEFTNNSATTTNANDDILGGGAVVLTSSSIQVNSITNIIVENCLFQSNNAVTRSVNDINLPIKGGGLCISCVSLIAMTNSYFLGNNATYGGGLYLQQPLLNSKFVNLQFEQNNAYIAGGAIFEDSIVNNDSFIRYSLNSSIICINNNASYGACLASSLQRLDSSSSNVNAWPGNRFQIVFFLLDGTGNKAIQPGITVSVEGTSNLFSSGEQQNKILVDTTTASYTFPRAYSLAAPGTVLNLTAGTIPSSLFPFTTHFTITSIECPPNHYLVSGSGEEVICEECPLGKYSLQLSLSKDHCTSCETVGLSNVCVQSCSNMNQYNNLNMDWSCLSVMAGYFPTPSLDNPTQLLVCPNPDACIPFDCISYFEQSKGSWETHCFAYSNVTNCSSTDYSGCCKEGFTERLCSRCKCDLRSLQNCYYRTSAYGCSQCKEWDVISVVIVSIVVVITLVFFAIFPNSTVVLLTFEVCLTFLMSLMGAVTSGELVIVFILLILGIMSSNKVPSGLVKSFVFYIQTLPFIVDNAWPQEATSISGVALESTYLPWTCISPSLFQSPVNQMVAYMLMPWVFIFLTSCAFCIAFIMGKFKIVSFLRKAAQEDVNSMNKEQLVEEELVSFSRIAPVNDIFGDEDKSGIHIVQEEIRNDKILDSQKSIGSEPPTEKHSVKSLLHSILRCSIFLIEFYYMILAVFIFGIFAPCQSGYMAYYLWIPCDFSDSDYVILFSLGISFLIVYVLGIPVLFGTLLLWKKNDIISANKETKLWLGCLYEDFKCDSYLYDLVLILRRLVFVAAVKLISLHNAWREEAMICIIFGSLLIHHLQQPFRTSLENIVETISLAILCLTQNVNSSLVDTTMSGAIELQWTILCLNILTTFVFLLLMILPSIQILMKSFNCSKLNQHKQNLKLWLQAKLFKNREESDALLQ